MIMLTLDQKELQALVGLMDAGLKAVGLQGADAASHLLRKITEAKAAADMANAEHAKPAKPTANGHDAETHATNM